MYEILKTISKGEYNYALVPDHPNATANGYVLEHRVVIENSINRLLTKDEIVHHKDENKKNNHLSNLELMTRSEHIKHHHSNPHSKAKLLCDNCGNIFEREWRNRPEIKKAKNTFCTRRCNGIFQRKKQLALASQTDF